MGTASTLAHITDKLTLAAGKSTLAASTALQLVTSHQWTAVHWVDLAGCTNDRAAVFAFLAACGVPSDVPDAAALLAWLARVKLCSQCICPLVADKIEDVAALVQSLLSSVFWLPVACPTTCQMLLLCWPGLRA